MDQPPPNYKTLYPWASSDLLGGTSDFTTRASIVTYRKSEHLKKNCLFGKEHDRFVKVVRVNRFVVMSLQTQRGDRSASFTPLSSKNFSFTYPLPVLRELFSLRLMSPLLSYTPKAGRLRGRSPSYVTTLTTCNQWTFSSISSKPKAKVKSCR